ncbi:centromere protein V-like [Sarcophilus harrisii]|uniref:centromere protein V-like n=1 Tax=Sarcophilus harrisii TaxID=9305 RepID=UPI001301BD00|nr:centromere protein V-like [Sarcophilus harrisii]
MAPRKNAKGGGGHSSSSPGGSGGSSSSNSSSSSAGGSHSSSSNSSPGSRRGQCFSREGGGESCGRQSGWSPAPIDQRWRRSEKEEAVPTPRPPDPQTPRPPDPQTPRPPDPRAAASESLGVSANESWMTRRRPSELEKVGKRAALLDEL